MVLSHFGMQCSALMASMLSKCLNYPLFIVVVKSLQIKLEKREIIVRPHKNSYCFGIYSSGQTGVRKALMDIFPILPCWEGGWYSSAVGNVAKMFFMYSCPFVCVHNGIKAMDA